MKLEDIKVGAKWTSDQGTRLLVRYVETEYAISEPITSVVFLPDRVTYGQHSLGWFNRHATPGWPIKLEVGKWYRWNWGNEPLKAVCRTPDGKLFILCTSTGENIARFNDDGTSNFVTYKVVEEVPAPEGF